MAINKVVYGQNTLIDLTSDTVSGNKMLSGTVAHDKSGSRVTGSISSKSAATITPTTSDQTIAAGQYLSGAQTIKGDANLIPANIAKGTTIFGVTGTHEGGGGGGGVNVATAEKTLTSAASSIQFTGLLGEPTSFAVVSASNLTTGASPYKTADVVFDGTNIFGQYITNQSNAQMTYSGSAFTKSYNNGTLTITGSGTNFQANAYKLVYTYGGSASDVSIKSATVGSGATSISFTGLDAEPTAFSCVLKGGNIGTASGYSRAQIVVGDGNNVFGLHMGSSSQASTSSWTTSYSNGTFTIRSASASNGGYFHQGTGFSYQLTYITESAPIGITTEPLSVTQNGTYTAPSGKAYTPVTVNVSGDTPQTQEKTVTPSASTQTVTPDSGKLLSKVTVNGDADLVASNIKSGVNIFGVTGTYQGGSQSQTASGTISIRAHTGSLDNQATGTVNCGFKPDIVLFGPKTNSGTYFGGAVWQANAYTQFFGQDISSGIYYCRVSSFTDTGFSYGMFAQSQNWGTVDLYGKQMPWTAIKYT